jgi:AraC-like DNA-binding protein
MNRSTTLLHSADLTVSRFDHPPHEAHDDPDREEGRHYGIAFVQEGGFGVGSAWLRPGAALLTQPGVALACHHESRYPTDVCLAIGFSDTAVVSHEHAWARAGWQARQRATPRLALVQRRLARAVDASDDFGLERWSLAALSALASTSQDGRARGSYTPRAADIDAVVACCRTIEGDPTSRRLIAERALAVGMTSTRLTHHFRRYLGVSPHQYVLAWRLAAAADLLDQGCSVSESCWRSGFENLSHFCRSFLRMFGVRPSAWRALALPERRRKVQAIRRPGL